MEITLETKIADLLNSRPDMKDILIGINPRFKKLNNPVLRRTLAKVASVKQAAVVGGMDAMDLLNQLRVAVGQEPVEIDRSAKKGKVKKQTAPEWIREEPKASFDGNAMLDREENPLAIITRKMKELQRGDVVTLSVDFKPEPLIDEFLKKGYEVYTEEKEGGYITYIQKR
jgi:TusA-related sulfurtransferase